MTAAQTFSYTGAMVAVTVPADASVATIECWGAQGANADATGLGGLGGYAKGDLPVTPGQVIYVSVGGQDGWNGGGDYGNSAAYAGGGASDVRAAGTGLANRVIVAGGGGGAESTINGTGSGYAGGGLSGGGYGGTQTSGGVDTTTGANHAGGAGQLGVGGGGVAVPLVNIEGGGGGGGYYGGGGGSGYQGQTNTSSWVHAGGGGSSYIAGLTNALTNPGIQSGNGQVTITWVNNPPLAPTPQTPANNSSTLTPVTVSWSPNDPDVGDAQTKADVQLRAGGASTWTLATVTGATPSYLIPAAEITVGTTYEWQVRTYDKTGAVGPWSGSFFFTAVATPPAPTITTPTAGATLMSTPAAVDWTLPSGQTSTAYQVRRVADNAGAPNTAVVYYDSGQVDVNATNAQVPLDSVYGRTDHIQVRYFAQVWSTWADVSIVVNAGPPQAPLIVATQNGTDPAVTVRIINPPQAAGYAVAVSNDLYRTSPDGVTIRIAAGLALNAAFTDLLPGAGVNAYHGVAYAASGSTSPIPS